MADMSGQAQKDAAMKIYSQFVAAQGSGIGAQDRTKGTQELWDKCNKESGESVTPDTAVAVVTDEADKTLNMLAFDAFPRFLKSKYCEAVMDELRKKSNSGEVNISSRRIVACNRCLQVRQLPVAHSLAKKSIVYIIVMMLNGPAR